MYEVWYVLVAAAMITACSAHQDRPVDTASVAVVAPTVSHPAPVDVQSPADSAAAFIKDYYRAINERRYNDAYVMWSDSGRTSRQTLDEFARGFSQTASVKVETGTPSRIEAAAGSRYITVPVSIEATTKSGESQRFKGEYDLRRSVVDGATVDQRAWRISSARIAEQH